MNAVLDSARICIGIPLLFFNNKFTVLSLECRVPMGLASGVILDSQINASHHIGELILEKVQACS